VDGERVLERPVGDVAVAGDARVDPELARVARSMFDGAPSLRAVAFDPAGSSLVLARPAEPAEIDALWDFLDELRRVAAHGYR
jgi:hypothetical protein